MPTLTISLPDSLQEFVEHQVAERGFGNASEYFLDLLRDAQENKQDLRLEQLLLESLASGEDLPMDESFWRNLRTEAGQMAEQACRKKTSPEKRL